VCLFCWQILGVFRVILRKLVHIDDVVYPSIDPGDYRRGALPPGVQRQLAEPLAQT
jgi:hypothetical protein